MELIWGFYWGWVGFQLNLNVVLFRKRQHLSGDSRDGEQQVASLEEPQEPMNSELQGAARLRRCSITWVEWCAHSAERMHQ